jgi:uracil-DNA glycosylase family 4
MPKRYRKPDLIPFDTGCTRCKIGQAKNNEKKKASVGGAGPQDLTQVKLIVISDHPGWYEEKEGYPFVHKQEFQERQGKKTIDPIRNAGALIRDMLHGLFGLDTYQEVYATNILKCDPGKVTALDSHYRTCSAWLSSEFEVLDEYCPTVPILIAGAKATRHLHRTFPDFKLGKEGINYLRRRKGVKIKSHPAVFTYNPAQVARSEPRIETIANPKNRRIKESDWMYPPLPGSPTDIMVRDLELLEPFLLDSR